LRFLGFASVIEQPNIWLQMSRANLSYFTLLAAALLLSACIYEAPITEKPTGKIDDRLVGDWTEEGTPDSHLIVCKLNDSEYIVSYEGVFHAWPSDFAGTHFVSVQNIAPMKESDRKYDRKFQFVVPELQENGKKLVIRTVNSKVIPETLHTTAEIQQAIKTHIKDPQFFNDEPGVFVRKETTP
jgi:hypothetical protein